MVKFPSNNLLNHINAGAYSKDRVRLSDIDVFTAKSTHFTAARRVSPVQQMSCVGGSAAGSGHHPSAIQCYNRGWDGRAVQWECKAELHERVKFGVTNVFCEGYDFPGDEYVLSGSCGVEYTLEYAGDGVGVAGGAPSHSSFTPTNESPKFSVLDGILIGLAVAWLVYAVYTCMQRERRPPGQTDDNRCVCNLLNVLNHKCKAGQFFVCQF
jgi:hypothetical protein